MTDRLTGGPRFSFSGGEALRRRLAPVLLLVLLLGSVALPLLVLMTAPPSVRRGDLHLASMVTSLVAASLLVATFVLPSRVRIFTLYLGVERLLRSHRALALVALGLVSAHVGLVLARSEEGPALLDLRSAPPRVWAGTIATVALVLMVCLAVSRRQRRPRYEGWRLAHVLLANIVLAGSALHVLWVSDLGSRGAGQAWFLALTVVLLVLSLNRWLWRPLRSLRKRYVVDEVREESPTAVTVVLHAVGHPGVDFRPGQFAWLKVGGSPFVFEEHPFTIASAATEPWRKEFKIKALGDFSEILAGLRPGRRVHLDGPHGSFTIDGLKSGGFVFLAGGVGVTPMLSMLRTLADRGDERPALLVVAGRTADDLLHQANHGDLVARLDLRVVEILEDPPEEWDGEVGWLSEEVLGSALPGHGNRWNRDYFICGPGPMVAAATKIVEDWGVSGRRIHTELFDVV